MAELSQAARNYLDDISRQPGARQPATLGEIWDAEWKRGGLDTITGLGKSLRDATDELRTAIETAAGKPLVDYAADHRILLGAGTTVDAQIKALNDLADTLPEEARKAIDPLRDVRRRSALAAQKIERDAAEVSSATYGLAGTATAWLASIARQSADPVNIAAMVATAPLGGPVTGSAVKFIAGQAVGNAISQAVVEPYIEPARAELGLESGFGRAMSNIFEAGIGGAIVGGAGVGLHRLLASVAPPRSSEFAPVTTPHPNITQEDFRAAALHAERDAAIDAEVGLASRQLMARLADENSVSLPIVNHGALQRLSEESALRSRDAELAGAIEGLPVGDQAAADRLARVRAVEQQIEAASPEERRTLLRRRDELLTDTTPEELNALAAPLEQRRRLEAERASIADRLNAIADEQVQEKADRLFSAMEGVPIGQRELWSARMDAVSISDGIAQARTAFESGRPSPMMAEDEAASPHDPGPTPPPQSELPLTKPIEPKPPAAPGGNAVEVIGDAALARDLDTRMATLPEADTLQFHIERPDKTIKTASAKAFVKEIADDAKAVKELIDCIGRNPE